MKKKHSAKPTPEEVELRRKIVDFVKAKRFRTELSIVEYIMMNLKLGGLNVSGEEATYQLARCVEDGPLVWFGADESKHGPMRAGSEPLKYRYDPLVSQKEKSMEIEGQAEIETLCALYRRLKKKERPVETTVQALNKVGARRPKKQRFALSYNPRDGQLTVRTKSSEWLPASLQKIANKLVLEEEQKEGAEV